LTLLTGHQEGIEPVKLLLQLSPFVFCGTFGDYQPSHLNMESAIETLVYVYTMCLFSESVKISAALMYKKCLIFWMRSMLLAALFDMHVATE